MNFGRSASLAEEKSMQFADPNWRILDTAVQGLAKYSPKFNWVGIYVLQNNELKLGPFVGEPTEHDTIPVGKGVCGTAVSENRDQNVPDVRARENYIACSLTTRSELVVLIKNSAGKILGQIDIDSNQPNAFGPLEEDHVRKVARELGTVWNA
jgi:L-methionine (R)-S-oxide reductase